MFMRKSHIYAYLIILFPICKLIGGFFNNYDEIIGLASFVYIWFHFFKNKLNKINTMIVVSLTIVTIIGVVSNIVSGIILKPFPIIIDILWLWKTFACFIFFSQVCLNDCIREEVIKVLSKAAKFVIILLFATSLIGQLINIGVTGNPMFFGLKQFNFFWNNGIQTGWLGFCALMVLSLSDCEEKKFYQYCFLTYIPLLLTGSSLVYCWIVVSLVLFKGMKKDDVFKIRYIVIIIVAVAVFAWSDLQVYFLSDSSSIRKTLIEYGIKVANMYFPLGSGFATYGSEMAVRYYSKLYQSFGWTNTWALGRNSVFLNDNFFASIIGQFGWFGFTLYLFALYNMFKSLNTYKIKKRVRVISISTVIVIFTVMIGSASAKSMMGVCTFAVLGIVYGAVQSNSNLFEG